MIIAQYGNSINVTAKALAAQRRADYDAGFEFFCDGLARCHCHNDDQRRGWDNALRSMAYAETVAWTETHEVYA